ncbi:heparan sulfate glucosamine 3-O-sulfotransferase 5 [Elysia marginata]|uniref:Heparan sulfate glucosamine 3-O-sulfotransferase 5 n=1 Tax=Elysia marginata TaxID=1093978 RepID=A0AAV4GL12_9GAST|nr:heparan sulfate glucosamine 3-O-sulfotransferase 5 [Elysia marginata]
MRHYVRLQVTSLVTLCVSLVVTSALLTCSLTLMFASPIAEVARRFYLPVTREANANTRGSLSLPARFEQREASQRETSDILIRHPKKNDLDPQPTSWLQRFLPANNDSNKFEQPQSRAPQCLLLGFAKCGTSALLEFLNLHPKIVTLDWEPDYFCDRMYKKYDLKWYVGRMPPSLPGQITIEKSPCYIVEHDAHIRIHAMNSSVKVRGARQ